MKGPDYKTISQEKMLEILRSNASEKRLTDSIESKPENDGRNLLHSLECLDELVGLDEAKTFIKKIIAHYEIQSIAKLRRKSSCEIVKNMCFVGNPGTAKTTFARIYAQILADKGIINRKFYECNRANLICKYAGHTAQNVKAIINKAKGGVLFVDEAYSLLEDKEGGFGDEAINTLVSEIENNRGRITVILAGYPEKMNQFLDSNPGLKSRFPYVINFPDYSAEELYLISEKVASMNGYIFADDVHDKLINIFNSAINEKDYGNGRFARNIVEQAELNRSLFLSSHYSDLSKLSDEQLFTLSAQEFDKISFVNDKRSNVKMGFCP